MMALESAAGQVRLVDRPPPTRGPDEVLLDMRYAGICGSDLQRFGLVPQRFVPGHEGVGVVVDGSHPPAGTVVAVRPISACGRCSLCVDGRDTLCERPAALGLTRDGLFAEQAAVPAAWLYPIEGLPSLRAVLADPLACVLHGLRDLPARPDGGVAIIGAGPIGACVALVLRAAGLDAEVFTKYEAAARRLRELGIRCRTKIVGSRARYDWVVDCVGRDAHSLEQALALARHGARVLELGMHLPEVTAKLRLRRLFGREITLHGRRGFSTRGGLDDFAEALRRLAKDPDFDRLVTHVLPFERFADGLELLRNRESNGAIKLVLSFDGERR